MQNANEKFKTDILKFAMENTPFEIDNELFYAQAPAWFEGNELMGISLNGLPLTRDEVCVLAGTASVLKQEELK